MQCTKCLIEKNDEEFPVNKYSGNRRRICTSCLAEAAKIWRSNNKELRNKLAKEYRDRKRANKKGAEEQLTLPRKNKYRAESNKRWREKNREHKRELDRANYYKNRERRIQYSKEWREANPEKYKETLAQCYQNKKEKYIATNKAWQQAHPEESKNLIWKRNKRKEDLDYRMRENLRGRIWTALKRVGAFKSKHTMELLGCDKATLRSHLERQFRTGMSWDNYGTIWQVDHIRPCASFDLTKEEEQKACFHYLNLQPLLVLENKLKGDSWPQGS